LASHAKDKITTYKTRPAVKSGLHRARELVRSQQPPLRKRQHGAARHNAVIEHAGQRLPQRLRQRFVSLAWFGHT